MAKETLPQGEVDALVREFETKLARLRNVYEQYFMGMERVPPNTLRKDVIRIARRLDNLFIRNTASKFKVRTLVQRCNTYKVYWDRTVRQIEEGTYVRDIQRARRNEKNRKKKEGEEKAAAGKAEDGAFEIDMDLDLEAIDLNALANDALSSTKPAPVVETQAVPIKQAQIEKPQLVSKKNPVKEAPAKVLDPVAQARADKIAKLKSRMKSNPRLIRGVSLEKEERIRQAKSKLRQVSGPASSEDQETRKVFNALVDAKKQCNESVAGLKYEELHSSLVKQKAHLKETRGAKDVGFNVVIKNGKAFLKPEIKK